MASRKYKKPAAIDLPEDFQSLYNSISKMRVDIDPKENFNAKVLRSYSEGESSSAKAPFKIDIRNMFEEHRREQVVFYDRNETFKRSFYPLDENALGFSLDPFISTSVFGERKVKTSEQLLREFIEAGELFMGYPEEEV